MMKERKLTVIKENKQNTITDTLMQRLNELLEMERIPFQTEIVPFNEEIINDLSGDILLLSFPLMRELPHLNRLKRKFFFVSFIDPYAYSQIDEKRLLKQVQQIDRFETTEISAFHPKNHWTYPDYFLAMTQMNK
ncbi:hypothetical protein [Enterococcus sp. DIV0756]|uniref:hypothetical protein n=1 Tax=Enterococcus sp. DIV0756 TaxID=2774636 RepID=UPI003F241569